MAGLDWWRPRRSLEAQSGGREPRLRPARPGDARACARIFLDRRLERFHWLDPAGLRLEDYAVSVRGEEVWVAEARGEVVGFASLLVSVGFVHNLFVRRDWDGRGVGRLLMEQARDRLGPGLTLKCVVQNAPARAFYERLGFREQRRGAARGVEYVLYALDEAGPGS